MAGLTTPGKVSVGHPVDVATGTLFHEVEDYVQPGRMPLALRRRYSTGLINHNEGIYGPGWSSPFEMRVRRDLEGYRLIAEDGETQIDFGVTGGNGAARGALINRGALHELREEAGWIIVTRWSIEGTRVVRYFFPVPKGDEWSLLASCRLPDDEGIDIERDQTGRIGVLRQRREKRGYRFAYGSDGRLAEVFLFARISEIQNSSARIRMAEHPICRYSYEGGRLRECVDPLGYRTIYLYDGRGRKIREVLKSGASWTFSYDSKDRCVAAGGNEGYDDRSLRYGDGMTEVTDSRGGDWKYYWNERGQVELVLTPLGASIRTEFDEYGRIAQRTDPNGHAYRFEYDEAGNRSAVIDPLGAVTRFEYGADRQRLRLVDKRNQVWARRYDDRGHLVAVADPTGQEWSFSWSAYGDLEALRSPSGATRHFRHDANGNVTEQTDPLGNVYRYEYDDFGNWTASVDPLGNRTQRVFNLRRDLTAIVWPDGSRTENEYEASGALRQTLDPTGRRTTYRTAGCTGELTSVDKGGALWQLRWDTEPQQLVEVRNPNGESSRFDYDAEGHLIREEGYDGHQVSYSYDPGGRLLSSQTGGGSVTHYRWSPIGLPTSVTYADGSTVAYRYDELGRLAAVEDSAGTVAFERDAYGRAIRESFSGFTIQRGFDGEGNLISQQSSLGHLTQYQYDANGRVVEVKVGGRPVSISRDAAGREIERRLPAGGRLEQGYDACGRLQTQSAGPGTVSGASVPVRRSYTYDGAGRLVEVDDAGWGSATFSYDERGRLVTARRESGEIEEYGFDAAGAVIRSRRAQDATAENPTYETRDLAGGGRVVRQGDTTYEYDAEGRTIRRIVRDGGNSPRIWNYRWDARGRLTSVVSPENTVWEYAYDAMDRRIRKLGPQGETSYRWSGDRVVHEIDSDGAVRTWDFLPGRAFPFSKTEGEATYYVVGDSIGTPRELMSSDGSLAWAGRISPWGELDREKVVATNCSARLPGQWSDSETGLSYSRFRYYAPWRQQYLSRDPVRPVLVDGSYSYPSDPFRFIDPFGLLAEVLYGDPDGLGRPTGATAVITPADIGTGTAANPSIRPPGFEGGNHPFHHERGHLIGNQLGGDGNDPRNLVTLTGGTNHPHMEGLEAQVRAHVEAGNFVEVKVTPIYEGDHPVPSGVKYEATDLATGQKIVDAEVENGQHKNYKGCTH